jgi:hypothetical protein
MIFGLLYTDKFSCSWLNCMDKDSCKHHAVPEKKPEMQRIISSTHTCMGGTHRSYKSKLLRKTSKKFLHSILKKSVIFSVVRDRI